MRGGVAALAAGHVETGAVHGFDLLTENGSVFAGDEPGFVLLGLVEGTDVRGGFHDDAAFFAGNGSRGAGEFFLRNGEGRFNVGSVELAGALDERLIAAFAHVRENGAHLIFHVLPVAVGGIAAFGQTAEQFGGFRVSGRLDVQYTTRH